MTNAADRDASKKPVRGVRVPVVDHLTVPQGLKSPGTYRLFARLHLIYSLAGLLLGLACILSGVVLVLHGVTGSTSWTASFIGATTKISDAAPGVVLFIVGLFVVWVTRFSIEVHKQ